MATSDNLNQLNIYTMWPPRKEHSLYFKTRVNSFCFSRMSDQVAAACDDRSIKVCNISRKNSSAVSYMCSRTCTSVDFPSSDAYMVSGHNDGKIRIWDLNDRKVSSESGKAQD